MNTTSNTSLSGITSQWNFLNRMKLGKKFALLGVIALVLIAYPLYQLVKQNRETINAVQTEQSGLIPLKTVLALVTSLQNHRTASSHFVLNDVTRSAPRPKAAAEIDEAFAKIDAQFNFSQDALVAKRLVAMKQTWLALKANVESRKLDSRRVLMDHTDLIHELLLFVADVTNLSQIDLDPDAGVYYTFQAALFDLPLLTESIRALRSPVVDRLEEIEKARKTSQQQGQTFNLDAALREAMQPADRARFAKAVQEGENAVRNYADNMRKAMNVSELIAKEQGKEVEGIVQSSTSALQLVRTEILNKEIPTINADDYIKAVNVSRSAAIQGADVFDILVAQLDRRASESNTQLTLTVGGQLALLTLGFLIATLTVRNITGTVADLQASVDQVREGNYAALTNITSQDEVGDLGRTVNELLLDRVAAQRQVEEEKQQALAENERLNDSVISILQAVHQLSQKDLTAKAPVTTDIIGTVSDSINLLTDETSKVLHGVNLIAGQVQQGSGRVKAQSELVSKTANDDRKNVVLMMSSLEDAAQSTNQVAALAEQSNHSAERATQATISALEAVNGTVRGMESIRETISETEKRIKRLGERSQEISGIVNLINTISERTHVLALNASMQAAVAGEAGRGFAVVAEEVQRLAESSRNATQQIATLVGNIQLETNETISTVNRTIGQVVQGSEQAQKAGDQMRNTQQITGELVAQVKRIAESSELQKEMSAGLLLSVQNIGKGAERTAQQMHVQNQETDTLLESARQLVESVGVFKLPLAA